MARSDADVLEEIRERYDYALTRWEPIRREAQEDMRFVAGDPWSEDDKKQRKDRPTIAPEEMGQYFNQVINQLRANPRGMHFAPTGGRATEAGARFYQNKARETEYRSQAMDTYIMAAENAIQRSYGFGRVTLKYESPRSANQEIWIEPFPDPDMVLPDPDHKRPSGSDMQFCFVEELIAQRQFLREHPDAKVRSFGAPGTQAPKWVVGDKIRRAEYWTIQTRPRTLLLVQPPTAAPSPRTVAPVPVQPLPPLQLFEDELPANHGGTILRELRTVDYPEVWMYLTNGVEILHAQRWLGKYIPIVCCYGKVLYVNDNGWESVKQLFSMTRFGRAPWKAFCYAASQQLEILGQVPKASVVAAEGQLAGHEQEWEEAPYNPKAFLLYKPQTDATGQQILPRPDRLAYLQSDNLQAIEVVKEGFRRSIQSAMSSNFLPTQALKHNEKSGVALDKMDQSASVGTFHFVDSYDHMIQQFGAIFEDLVDKVYDYQGETGVLSADNQSAMVKINDPSNPEAVSTAGDYLVTVSSGPSSDSEREAVQEFLDTLIANLVMIAQIAGAPAAKQLLARSVRMRNGGPMMDQIADLLDPPPPNGPDGKPVPPALMAAQQKIQELTQQLQQAGQMIQTKQIEQQGKMAVVQVQEQAETQRAAYDREVKLAVAEIAAQTKQALQDMALFYEERARLGAQLHDAAMGGAEAAHTVAVAKRAAMHESIENMRDRIHDRQQQQAQNDGAVRQALIAKQAQASAGPNSGAPNA